MAQNKKKNNWKNKTNFIYMYIYEHKYWKSETKIKAQKQQKTSV
jgi:hypothetical protein